MAFSDSNKSNRFKGVGRVLKDLKSYTTSHGQQACNAIKANELVYSIKQSKDKFPGLRKNRVLSGNMKHQSLREDDEVALWANEYEDNQHQGKNSTGKQMTNFPSQKQKLKNGHNWASPSTPEFSSQAHLSPSSPPELWNNLKGTDFSFITHGENHNRKDLIGQNNKYNTSSNHSGTIMGFRIPFLGKVK